MKLYFLLPEIRPANLAHEFHGGIFAASVPDGAIMRQIASEAKKMQQLLEGEEAWELYYSGELMDEWETWFRDFSEEFPVPAYNLLQAALLRSDAIRWEDMRSSNPAFEIHIMGGCLADNIVAEAAYEKIQPLKPVVLLINADALSETEKQLSFSCDGGRTYQNFLDIRKLDVMEIALFLSEMRCPERVFYPNPKHGECRREAHLENGDKVSPLKCTKERALKLLHLAFGYKDGLVWAYDDVENQLVEFKWQSDYVWHGYHIDEEDEKKRNIPPWLRAVIKHVHEMSC